MQPNLSKQQELVEHKLLSQPSIEPVKRSVVSDPLAIRVKQEDCDKPIERLLPSVCVHMNIN
jgi:hypothetical protein